MKNERRECGTDLGLSFWMCVADVEQFDFPLELEILCYFFVQSMVYSRIFDFFFGGYEVYSRPTSLSPYIVWRILLICTSMVVEHVETEALSAFSAGYLRIPLYDEEASTIRKFRCRVYPSMVKGRVILLMELMLRLVNPIRGVVWDLISSGGMSIWSKASLKRKLAALLVSSRIGLMAQ